MSDFLSNLIARSFAEQPAIRPRLTSLFESASTESLSEVQSVAPVATAVQTQQPVNSIKLDFVSPEKASVTIPVADASVPSRAEPQPSEINQSVTVPQPQNAPLPRSNGESLIDPELKKAIVPVPSMLETKKQGLAAKTKLFREFTDRATFKSAHQNVFSQHEPHPPAPAIHVTIGRVEVRAIHSAAPTPKPAKAAAPKLSLDDYLQKRDGGAR